jgi:hypothetical protein
VPAVTRELPRPLPIIEKAITNSNTAMIIASLPASYVRSLLQPNVSEDPLGADRSVPGATKTGRAR